MICHQLLTIILGTPVLRVLEATPRNMHDHINTVVIWQPAFGDDNITGELWRNTSRQ